MHIYIYVYMCVYIYRDIYIHIYIYAYRDYLLDDDVETVFRWFAKDLNTYHLGVCLR